MITIDEETIAKAELQYPGFRESLLRFDAKIIPPCPSCKSEDTASVTVGVVGRSIAFAVATSKLKLVPNRRGKEDLYCNNCNTFFKS